jgi:hypothetical protein
MVSVVVMVTPNAVWEQKSQHLRTGGIDLDQHDGLPGSLGYKGLIGVTNARIIVNWFECSIALPHARGCTMKDEPTSGVLAAIQEGQQRLMTSLEQLRNDLLSRIDRVDSAITAIRDDITATMRLADRAQEAADHTRAGLSALGDRVTAMMHQIQDDAILSANSYPRTGFRSSEKVALIAPPIARAVVSCA